MIFGLAACANEDPPAANDGGNNSKTVGESNPPPSEDDKSSDENNQDNQDNQDDEDEEEESPYIDGIGPLMEWEWCGVVISVAEVGFVVGESYTIEYTIRRDFIPGFRIRYTTGGPSTSFNFSLMENDVVNSAHSSDSAKSAGNVASQIPALFEDGAGLEPMTEGVLIANFIFGEEIPDIDPPYLDYIGLFGLYGETGYAVLGVVIKDADGNIIGSRGEPQSAE
jgi:hypothetical protein